MADDIGTDARETDAETRVGPVRDHMSTDVISFQRDEDARDAMRRMVQLDVDAGPVLDDDGAVVGVLSAGDLIVQEAQLHFPAMFNFLGVEVQWPSWKHRHLDDDINKALGSEVGDVMSDRVITVEPDDTIELAATLMHDEQVSRLPVVEGGRLVGLISRNDILRALLAEA